MIYSIFQSFEEESVALVRDFNHTKIYILKYIKY